MNRNKFFEKCQPMGFFTIEKINPKTGEVEEISTHVNKVTPHGLRTLLAYFGSVFNINSESNYGAMNVLSGYIDSAKMATAYNIAKKKSDEGLTLYGLNYTGSTALTHAPFINEKGEIDDSMITFYASDKIESPNIKEGVIANVVNPTLLEEGTLLTRSWFLPQGHGLGRVTALCLATQCHTNPFNSGLDSRVISPTLRVGETVHYMDRWCMPGVKGITEANEILFGSSTYNSSKALFVMNLDTYIVNQLEDIDPRRDIILGDANGNQIVDGDYWWRIEGRSIRRRTLSTGEEKSISGKSSTLVGCSLFLHEGYVYESRTNTSSTTTNTKAYAYDKISMTYTSAKDIAFEDFNTSKPDTITKFTKIDKVGAKFLLLSSDERVVLECDDYSRVSETITNWYPSDTTALLNYEGVKRFLTTNEKLNDFSVGQIVDTSVTPLKNGGIKLIYPDSGGLFNIVTGVTDTSGVPIIQDDTSAYHFTYSLRLTYNEAPTKTV